jgi:hypothetical protein
MISRDRQEGCGTKGTAFKGMQIIRRRPASPLLKKSYRNNLRIGWSQGMGSWTGERKMGWHEPIYRYYRPCRLARRYSRARHKPCRR